MVDYLKVGAGPARSPKSTSIRHNYRCCIAPPLPTRCLAPNFVIEARTEIHGGFGQDGEVADVELAEHVVWVSGVVFTGRQGGFLTSGRVYQMEEAGPEPIADSGRILGAESWRKLWIQS